MHMLSSREILRLAYNNKLSLPLRHEWRKKTGWDPVNQESYCIHRNFAFLLGGAGLAGFLLTVLLNSYFQGQPMEGTNPWEALSGIASVGVMLIGLCWWVGFCYSPQDRNIHTIHESIRKPLSLFLHWINQAPGSICMKELSELREIAANVLRDLIGRHLNHLIDTPDPQDLGYAAWAGANADLAGEFREKYRVLYRLGLVVESEQEWYEKVRAERNVSPCAVVEPAASDRVPGAAEA